MATTVASPPGGVVIQIAEKRQFFASGLATPPYAFGVPPLVSGNILSRDHSPGAVVHVETRGCAGRLLRAPRSSPVHNLAANNRIQNDGLRDLYWWDGKNVTVKHSDVGQLACFQAAFFRLVE